MQQRGTMGPLSGDLKDFSDRLRAMSPTSEDGDEAEAPSCAYCRDVGWIGLDLRRDDPGFGRIVPCTRCQVHADRLRLRRWKEARFPPAYAALTIESYRGALISRRQPIPAWLDRLEAWTLAEQPESLYLYGPPGRGKTGLAIAATRARQERAGEAALYTTAIDLWERMRRAISEGRRNADPFEPTPEDILELARESPLLVLDDLGVERLTEYVAAQLFRLVDYRRGAELPTIYASNYSLAGLLGKWGEEDGGRLLLRIQERCTPIHVGGPNLRIAPKGGMT